MNDKQRLVTVMILALPSLYIFWAGIQYLENRLNLTSGQTHTILDIICYTLFSITIVGNVTGKMRLGRIVFHIQDNNMILNAPFVLFLIFLFLLILFGIYISSDRIYLHLLAFFCFLSVFYRGCAYEIREKGIVLGERVYRWGKIQQINIVENKIEKNTCSILRNNGKFVPCNIDLLENNRNEILDLLREKTSVNLINDGQECAAHSTVLAEQATRLH